MELSISILFLLCVSRLIFANFSTKSIFGFGLKYYFYKGQYYNNKVVLDTLLLDPMGYARTLRSFKSLTRYRATINLGAVESKILGEKPPQYILQTTQLQMKGVKSLRK